jgi:predicted ATPase
VQQQLLDYLRDKELLLVFDNFEHLLAGVDLVKQILSSAAQVKILATSRVSLRLEDEWLRQIRGLDYPDATPTQAVDSYSAVQLFIDRAQRLRNDLDFDTQSDHVGRLCQLVEGMPLALELAAGWVKVLSCQDIADEIGQNLSILTARAQDAPLRHRSMQVVFNHS